MAFPTGEAYPCCLGEMNIPIGDMRENTLEEIWHGEKYKQMRQNMLDDLPCKECTRCYEQEKQGFLRYEKSHNKTFWSTHSKSRSMARNLVLINYWDIRFSNPRNLKCRSCGSMFSSPWFETHVKMHVE